MTESFDDRYNKSENATRYIKQRVADIAPTLDSNDEPSKKNLKIKPALWTSILAGGLAGVAVDFTLYPLDTIKTRLQSEEGFKSSGGFRKLYKGIFPVLLCSAPISALFFGVYNTIINTLRSENSSLNPFVYLVAAPAAELVGSVFRIPIEVIKQRKQTSNSNSFVIMRKTFNEEGFRGFYRGYWSFVMREVPFAAIQYPVWEYMLNQVIIYQHGEPLNALQTAYCGSLAGAIAAILTTPVDVIKTRIMLAEKKKIEMYKSSLNYNFAKEVYHDRGIMGFFAGVIPRTLWIMFGGFIYFGAYEQVKLACESKCYWTQKVRKLQDIAPSYFDETFETFIYETNLTCNEEPTDKEVTEKETTLEKEAENQLKKHEENILDSTLLEPSVPLAPTEPSVPLEPSEPPVPLEPSEPSQPPEVSIKEE